MNTGLSLEAPSGRFSVRAPKGSHESSRAVSNRALDGLGRQS